MTDYSNEFGRYGLNDRIDVDRIVDGIGLDREELEWRKAFIDFTESDARRLERFEEVFEDHADEIADSFYDHLTDFEETTEIISRSPRSVEGLKSTQKAYLMTLATGEYDLSYFRDRARIGKLHDVLGMPLKHYLGQYNVYYSLLLSLVTDRIHEQLSETVDTLLVDELEHCDAVDGARLTRRLYEDVEEGVDDLHSILKVLNLDMQVAVDTYIQSHYDDLEVERDRFAALFENVPTPVVAVRFDEDDGRVEEVNPAFEELFGYTAADLEDKPFERLLRPPGEEPRPIEDESVAIGDVDTELTEVEVTLKTQFGRREFIRVSAPVDRPGLDDLEYAFYIDVTDQKQRQERLQVLSRVLRHDIRNRLNVITGCASTMRESPDREAREAMADQIEAASGELLRTSKKIRQVERLIAGRADRRPVDVSKLAETVVETTSGSYPDCEFVVSIPETMWVKGTDALRIALENVVENGAEHNDADDPRVEVTAIESLSRDHVDVRVADNGPGIPPAEYEVLTGERPRSQMEHTSGLGLWAVNWVVTKAGGTLQFDANSPRGTIVTLRLPQSDPVET